MKQQNSKNQVFPTSIEELSAQPHVHVWRANLDFVDENTEVLSEDEQTRANRFHFEKDRKYFITARVILRKLLGAYLSVSPAQLQFTYAAKGKPELIDNALQFNLSHSKNWAIYAISKTMPVGIDIEAIAENREIDNIAQRFFSPEEFLQIKNLQGKDKLRAFYNGWTRKEALLKGIGEGLQYSLAKVVVDLADNISQQTIFLTESSLKKSKWNLYSLTPIEGFAAALAVNGEAILKTIEF
jgi:4'-phosphopantetheinyl transferase